MTVDAGSSRAAIALYLLAGLLFAGLDATSKWLVLGHGVGLVLWARFIGQTLVVAPFVVQRCGMRFWRTRQPVLQIARSAVLLNTTALLIVGLRYLPIAEVTAIMLLSPIFVVLLARPVLGERATPARRVAAAAGFVGAAILVRPGSAVFQPAALLLFAASISHAVFAIMTRKLHDEPAPVTLFYSGLAGAVGLTLALPWLGAEARVEWLPLVLLGLFAGGGHWCMILAFMRAPASMLAPLTYAQVVWATFTGWIVFGHLPDVASFLGMAVIVASGVAFVMMERR